MERGSEAISPPTLISDGIFKLVLEVFFTIEQLHRPLAPEGGKSTKQQIRYNHAMAPFRGTGFHS